MQALDWRRWCATLLATSALAGCGGDDGDDDGGKDPGTGQPETPKPEPVKPELRCAP